MRHRRLCIVYVGAVRRRLPENPTISRIIEGALQTMMTSSLDRVELILNS